jgi:Na+/H+-dicarboxylate symporter
MFVSIFVSLVAGIAGMNKTQNTRKVSGCKSIQSYLAHGFIENIE